MSEHSIKFLNIERYKCFTDFSSEDFKRVNLISGKNNASNRYQLDYIESSSNEEALYAF